MNTTFSGPWPCGKYSRRTLESWAKAIGVAPGWEPGDHNPEPVPASRGPATSTVTPDGPQGPIRGQTRRRSDKLALGSGPSGPGSAPLRGLAGVTHLWSSAWLSCPQISPASGEDGL